MALSMVGIPGSDSRPVSSLCYLDLTANSTDTGALPAQA